MPSTAIRSLSYDQVTSTLFVTFVDGDLYAYFEVPAKLYDAFKSARSKGGFFAKHVRPRYRYKKVGEQGVSPPLS
jgi:lysyl-tRNA synthetase class 2